MTHRQYMGGKRALDVTAMILAGGGSTRFGRDKALAEVDGEAMILRVHRAVSKVTSDVLLSLRPGHQGYQGVDARAVYDRQDGGGPMVGIHAGLKSASADWLLVVACDMPYVTASALEKLLEARSEDVDAVIATDADGGLHPACSCYHRRILPTLETSLNRGQRSLLSALRNVPYVEVRLPGHVLANVNYESDVPVTGNSENCA